MYTVLYYSRKYAFPGLALLYFRISPECIDTLTLCIVGVIIERHDCPITGSHVMKYYTAHKQDHKDTKHYELSSPTQMAPHLARHCNDATA